MLTARMRALAASAGSWNVNDLLLEYVKSRNGCRHMMVVREFAHRTRRAKTRKRDISQSTNQKRAKNPILHSPRHALSSKD